MARVVPVLVLLVWCLTSCSAGRAGPNHPATVRFASPGDETVLRVRVARTEAEKERGLMGVRSLPEDGGMAFVWTEPTETAFWMKDTLIPLSIAFVDDAGRIQAIREMRPCRSEPCPVYRSDGPFVLAIEANAGWFRRNGISVGDRATLEDA